MPACAAGSPAAAQVSLELNSKQFWVTASATELMVSLFLFGTFPCCLTGILARVAVAHSIHTRVPEQIWFPGSSNTLDGEYPPPGDV